jgi:hypothetical protein
MNLQEAGELLSGCEYEGEDTAANGDSVRCWWKDGKNVAEGYAGIYPLVTIFADAVDGLTTDIIFRADEARQLWNFGTPMGAEPNSSENCGVGWPE